MINYSGGLSYITQAMYRARRVLVGTEKALP